MNFRFATLKALVSAGLLAGFCLGAMMAKAQTNSEQSILFSTPDGQSVSNALLPSAAAPGTAQALTDLPDNTQSGLSFNGPQTQVRMSVPQPMLNARKTKTDEMDFRKRMGIQTPSDVMGLPSMRELFGLPAAKATNGASQYGKGMTNMFSASSTAASDAHWAKILSADSDAFGSSKSAGSNSLNGGFFDSADRESMFHDKRADDQKGDDDFDTASFAQANNHQPAWDSAIQIAAPANNLMGYTPNAAPAPMPAATAFNAPSLNSQSPFELPKVSTPDTAMPQLPTLPGVPRQTQPSQPATPSWAPKPPPWLDPTPPLGTMAQRKF